MRNDMNEYRINDIKKYIAEKTKELNCIPDIIKIKEQEDDSYEVDIDGDIWSNYCSVDEVDTIVSVLFKGIVLGQQMNKNINAIHLNFNDLNEQAKEDVMDEAYKLISDDEFEELRQMFHGDINKINNAERKLAERKLYELNFVFNV